MASLIRTLISSTQKAVEDTPLGEKAKVKETVHLFEKIWQLPSFRGVLGIMAAEILIVSSITTGLKIISNMTPDPLLTFVLYIIILGIPTYFGSGILYLILTAESSPLDARRTAGSVMFGNLIWFIMGIIGVAIDSIIYNQIYEIRFWTVGASLGYLMYAFLVNALSDHREARNFIGAAAPLVLWLILELVLAPIDVAVPELSQLWYVTLPIIIAISTFVVHYLYRSVSVPFERDLGINGPALLRAFGHDYLSGNPKPIDELLTEISTPQDVPIEIIIFRDAQNESGLLACGIIQYVHPGPFRDVGSSGLPSVIMEHVKEKYGIPTFVMHGTCTHQQNLTTKDDYQKVLNEIDYLIENTAVHHTISGPHWTEGDKFKVWTLFAGENVLAITTSAPDFTDDIALEVGYDAANMVRQRLPEIKGVAIVDAHNCINDHAISVVEGDPDAQEYVGAVSGAVFSTLNEPRSATRMGIYQVYPNDILPREGIGPGGLSAVSIIYDEYQFALISVDGNNMEPGFRERVISTLKAQGYDNAEVVTTDTHVVNAISLSSKGYPPVGRNKPDETLEHILIASLKAREKTQAAKVGLGFGIIKGIRTLGERGFDILTQDIIEAAGIAQHVGIRVGIGSVFAAILLAFLL
jgi:predicted neutral ceramidase superfamily lipid hydrolase